MEWNKDGVEHEWRGTRMERKGGGVRRTAGNNIHLYIKI